MKENVISLLKEYTDLSPEERQFIADYASGLSAVADLCGDDVFLDCLTRDGNSAVVAAEARRKDGRSLYQEDVFGKLAFPDREPGVFRAFRTGETCLELRALTQENVPVQQTAAPVFSPEGKVIAVLIREKNIQDEIAQNRKYEEAAQTNQRLMETLDIIGAAEERTADLSNQYLSLQLREMSHRIKNNLQMVASLMNMEARRCRNAEAETILGKNVARILTVASFHDMLTTLGAGSDVAVRPLILRVIESVRTCLPEDGCQIEINVSDSDLVVSADIAGALMIVINELVTNSVKHAFSGRENGRIQIEIREDPPYRSIVISDDGIGTADDIRKKRSLGLSIVEATVKDKIKGVFSISGSTAGNGGVNARIDF